MQFFARTAQWEGSLSKGKRKGKFKWGYTSTGVKFEVVLKDNIVRIKMGSRQLTPRLVGDCLVSIL